MDANAYKGFRYLTEGEMKPGFSYGIKYRTRSATAPAAARRRLGPHSCSLFSAHLDGPPDPWVSPHYLQYIDWPVGQTWRRALIDATGIKPRKFED